MKTRENIDVFEVEANSGTVYRIGMKSALTGAWVSVARNSQPMRGVNIRPIFWVLNASQLPGIIQQIEASEK